MPAQSRPPAQAPVLVLQGVGKGIVPINGDWQFHLGDDLRWAQPSFDDSQVGQRFKPTTRGVTGHPSYTGFAWYRRHVDILPAPGETGQYSVFIQEAQDAYEVYWNGKLIGRYGRLPPHAYWYYSIFPAGLSAHRRNIRRACDSRVEGSARLLRPIDQRRHLSSPGRRSANDRPARECAANGRSSAEIYLTTA